MNKKKIRLEGDLSLLALVLLILVCLIFAGNGMQEQWEINIAMFCAASISLLVTYFFSITAGLVTDLLVLFVYINYILYEVFRSGETIDLRLYFWIIWIPLTTVAFHFFVDSTKRLQTENEGLQQRVEELTMRDETTGLENLYSFENTCLVYMRIAERYNMSLVLLVWDLRYENEIKRLLGKQKFAEEIRTISAVARKTLREEDSLFLLQDSPHLWGTVMFTNSGGEAKVVERLKEKLEEEWQGEGKEKIQIDLRFGIAFHENGNRAPLGLLEKAKKRLSYDVT